MYKSGALADMRRRGIEHISYWQVDNPLVYPLDRLFIGLHALLGSDMSCRSLTKSGPYEKLGHFCVCDGRTVIIEYSDMPAKLCEEVDTEGRLRYGAGSPAIHVLSRRFVEDMTAGGELRLPWHRAEKKVPCVDERGNRVTPAKPNAVKLEMFIFDALPEAKNVLILEADRNEQFGPVKNAEGEDSPASCRHLMIERAARWLNSAGIPVPHTADGQADCVIELSPKTYLDPEDVAAQATRIAPPARGAKEYYP
jgi:UDP-N-acetylglucosamine/UDP-N-acetylgalactosamine diphosphorylase